MIGTKGVKHEKVQAAFEYAEIFVDKSSEYGELKDDTDDKGELVEVKIENPKRGWLR